MNELVWLTLAAIGVVLLFLIPGNYLISRFWERDPSNLEYPKDPDGTYGDDDSPRHWEQHTGEASEIVLKLAECGWSIGVRPLKQNN